MGKKKMGQAMKDERGSRNFEANLSILEMELRGARERGALDETDHANLLRRAREAKTMEELRQIGRDLARIVGARLKGVPERDPG